MAKLNSMLSGGLEWIRSRVDEGVFPRCILPIADAAELGNAELQDIVSTFVKDAIVSARGAMRRLIAGLSDTGARFRVPVAQESASDLSKDTWITKDSVDIDDDPVFEIVLPPRDTEMLALARLATIRNPQSAAPAEHEAKIFEGIEYARGERIGELEHTTEQKVRAGLAEKMAAEILWSMRASSKAVFIPPPPSEAGFLGLVTNKIGAGLAVMEAWEASPVWPLLVRDMFADILAHGVAPDQHDSVAEEMETGIEMKRAWFRYTSGLGLHLENLDKAVAELFGDRDRGAALKVLAEYSRFEPAAKGLLTEDPIAVKELYFEMKRLHEFDPTIEGGRFLTLLTPYFDPMDYDNLVSILSRKNPMLGAFKLFLGQNMLAWHAEPAGRLAKRLTDYIKDNGKYRTLPELCAKKLGFAKAHGLDSRAPDAFLTKLRQLVYEGADIAPLITAIEEQFPGAIPDDFDPGDAPPHNQPPPAPAAGGIATESGGAAPGVGAAAMRSRGRRARRRRKTRGQLALNLSGRPKSPIANAAVVKGGPVLGSPARQLRLPNFTNKTQKI